MRGKRGKANMKMAQPGNERGELLHTSEVPGPQQETGPGGQVQNMEEEIDPDPGGVQGCLSTTSCRACGLFALTLGACCLVSFVMSIPILPVLGKWACSETEVVRHCQHGPLILEVKEPLGTPPGTQCKVLATGGKEQPCCYNDKGLFGLNDVCFEDTNMARRTEEDACRVGSRYPDVKMVDKNCTITLKDLKEQDAGCYEFYMPPNSKEPFYRKCVQYNEICHDSVKHSCEEKQWQIQFIWCALILALFVTVAVIRKRTLRRRRRGGEGVP